MHWVCLRFSKLRLSVFLRFFNRNISGRFRSFLHFDFAYNWRPFGLSATNKWILSTWNLYFWNLANWLRFWYFGWRLENRLSRFFKNFFLLRWNNLCLWEAIFFHTSSPRGGWPWPFLVQKGNLCCFNIALRLSFCDNFLLFWSFVLKPRDVFFDGRKTALKADVGTWIFWNDWVIISSPAFRSLHLWAVPFIWLTEVKWPHFIHNRPVARSHVPFAWLLVNNLCGACHLCRCHHLPILFIASTRRSCPLWVDSSCHRTIGILTNGFMSFLRSNYILKWAFLGLNIIKLTFWLVKSLMSFALSAQNRSSLWICSVDKLSWRWVY